MTRRPIRHLTIAALAALAAGCAPTQGAPPAEPVPLPFVLSDYYSPDGLWGDGEMRGSVVVTKSCAEPAPGGAGDCYTITYTPGDKRFAGIDWQYPHNNWGTAPGLRITPGATRIRFMARGDKGGEMISIGAGQSGTARYKDQLSVSGLDLVLTPTWTAYELPLQGQRYDGPDGVIGGFIVSMRASSSPEPTVFQLDDVRWQP
jgi:hypothetical protein